MLSSISYLPAGNSTQFMPTTLVSIINRRVYAILLSYVRISGGNRLLKSICPRSKAREESAKKHLSASHLTHLELVAAIWGRRT